MSEASRSAPDDEPKMSARATADDDDDAGEAGHPRSTTALFGHAETESALLTAYRSGRVPHAFLMAGPQGIGKATLAYRLARFVLAHPDPASREVQAVSSLAVGADDPVARRIAAQAQPDLLILERTFNDKGVLHKQIAV
jgi:DNA polymerase III subunit delta'